MIVVDTNILVAVYIQGPRSGKVHELLQRDSQWRVPQLWQHEFLNVLATYGRVGKMSPVLLAALWQKAYKENAALEEPLNMAHALDLALIHQISGYDAQFVGLAETLNVPLITEDRKLQATLPQIAVSIEQFLSRPNPC
jgi:predicted nucleic acid-binding protein